MPISPYGLADANDIEVPKKILDAIDTILAVGWTRRDRSTGRCINIEKLWNTFHTKTNLTDLVAEIMGMYEDLGWKVKEQGGRSITFTPPSIRRSVSTPINLGE